MKKNLASIIILLAVLMIASEYVAQGIGAGRMGGWGRQSPYQRLYNPAQ